MTEKKHKYDKKQTGPLRSAVSKVLDLLPGFEEIGASTQEIHFALEYITNGFNASGAYRRIYPSWKGDTRESKTTPTWFLRRPKVQELIALYMTTYLREKSNELQHRVVDTLFTQAFYDPSIFMNEDGSPRFKSWDEIPENLRCCVKRIDTRPYGKGCECWVSTIILEDRTQALMTLAKYCALMQAGPGAGTTSRHDAVSPETELLLSSVLSGSRGTSFQPQRNPNTSALNGFTPKEKTDEKKDSQGETGSVVSISGLG